MTMILSNLLKRYAKKKETQIQLKYLYKQKNINILNNKSYKKDQSIFLHNELSIRLSHRIFDLMKLPYGLPTIPEINNVIDLYYNSFSISSVQFEYSFHDGRFYMNLHLGSQYYH